MIAIRVCPTCKRKFEARVGEPQTYCEECLELKTMSESSVCSWFFDDDDFDDDFDISEAGKEEKADRRVDGATSTSRLAGWQHFDR